MTKDLTQGSPIKNIIIMSLPIMLGNFFQQLYSVVDTVIVGRFISSDALAAVGSTASFYYLIMWFVCGMAGGFAIVLALNFGAGDMERLRKNVCISLELSAAVTLVVTFVSVLGLKRFIRFMNTPDEIFQDAYIYILIIVVGLMATMLYNICASILRAMGDSKTPLYFLIISSLINIVLDLWFICSLKMGVAGAAFATIISQGVSGVACFIYMYMHFPELRFKVSDWTPDKDSIKEMFSYGLPAGFLGAATAIGILILQFAINCYGTDIIAGFTAAIKVQNFVEIPLNALSMTMINYEGQNLGAGNRRNMKNGYGQCIWVGMLVAGLLGIVIYFKGDVFSSVFVNVADSENVIIFATRYLKYTALMMIPYSVLLITRSTLQGTGDKAAPVINGLFESVLRAAYTIFLMHNLSEILLCVVNPSIWLMDSMLLVCMYIHRNKVLDRTLPLKE